MSEEAYETLPRSCEPSCSATSGEPSSDLMHGRQFQSYRVRPAAITAVATTGATVSMCAACCVAPLLWPALFAGASSSLFAWLERGQRWMTLASLAVVIVAWIYVLWVGKSSGKKLNASTATLMGGATLLAAIAAFWVELEPHLVSLLE